MAQVAAQQLFILFAADLLVHPAEETLQLHFALQLHQAVKHRFGPRRTAGYIDIDRQNLVHAVQHVVRLLEGSAADGAAAHGDHILRIGHLVVKAPEHRGHFVGDGAGDHDEVGLTRRGAGHFEPKPGEIVTRRAHGHELDAAAARGEGQRPQAVAAAPLDQLVQTAHDHVRIVVAQFGDHLFEVFVVVEIFVFHRLDLRFSLYFHSKAPFRHAYARPKIRTTKKKRMLTSPCIRPAPARRRPTKRGTPSRRRTSGTGSQRGSNPP